MSFSIFQDQHPYCCGVDELGGFSVAALWSRASRETYWWDDDTYGSPNHLRKSGTGLYTAAFINNEECKAAYDWLCEHKTLLFQTPVKKNRGHKNGGMFMCVFQDKKRGKK